MGGHGHIVLSRHGSCYVFEEFSYSYPLKLLSPRLDNDSKVALSYIVGYGGGLVGGDRIELTARVELEANLLLLTQVLFFDLSIVHLLAPLTHIGFLVPGLDKSLQTFFRRNTNDFQYNGLPNRTWGIVVSLTRSSDLLRSSELQTTTIISFRDGRQSRRPGLVYVRTIFSGRDVALSSLWKRKRDFHQRKKSVP